MEIYKNRYQALKERKTNPYRNGAEKVVKVCGGYVLMTETEYRNWKKQK